MPLLKTQGGNYFINDTANKKLSQFGKREVHVVSVIGPTRQGKSFTMKNLQDKFETTHFGNLFQIINIEAK